MKRDVAQYITQCDTCQCIKIKHQRPGGLLQPLGIPKWKWDHVTMDFMTNLPQSPKGNNAIWVIIDQLIKSTHFLPIKMGQQIHALAQLYIEEIVQLHRIPASVVSDRDPRFTSRFWESFHKCMGIQLKFSMTYHPQTNGQSERTIQMLEDMLRTCILDFLGSWEKHLPLVEFAYNNGHHSNIGMAPCEALYG